MTPQEAPRPARGPAAGANPKQASSPVPRRALRWPTEVAAALGLSDDFVRDHGLAAELPMIRVGSLRLVAVDALDAWLADRAHLPLQGNRTCGASESPANTGDAGVNEARVKPRRSSWR